MLEKIQALYQIEERAREGNLSSDDRFKLRQDESIPILEAMEKWLHENCTKVLPKNKMGIAIGYMMSR